MPGHFVKRRADVVFAVDDRDILVVIEMFAELLESRMEVADIGCCLQDAFAVELENQAKCGVCSGMLGTEIERPARLPGLGLELRFLEQWGGHSGILSGWP